MKHVEVRLLVVLDVDGTCKRDATGQAVADELRRAIEEDIAELWPDDNACYDVRFASVRGVRTAAAPGG